MDIKEKIENSGYYKFQGIAPEGFILIPEEILLELQDFDNWKEFKKDGSYWLEERSKKLLRNRTIH